MKIRLDKIGAEPFQWQETEVIAASRLERDELLDLSPVSWSGRVWIDGPGYRLAAKLSYEQTVACDRCLAPSGQTVESSVRFLVLTGATAPTAAEVELTAADLEILRLDGEVLDTDAILLEQLELNVPMRAICREDCQGLCPQCGVNRNLESCHCAETRVDPRWEALRGLKE